MPGPGAQLGALYPPSDTAGPGGDLGGEAKNPLLCCLCNDYFTDPCLLQCYHTFCSKCLRGREVEGRIPCPMCGSLTVLKENSSLPPTDILMKQLIDLVNTENPPCANCDKRDKNSMHFCTTCGQALCTPCRENTHRAKMFSTHDVMHMSKCTNENQRRCPVHGEQYIMFNNAHKSMLCMTCFRDTPAETRMHCVDMETAYIQCGKKLDRALVAVCDVQNSVREGLLMVKTHLEELRRNMDMEKHTINTFCQGMQETISKTHSSMIMEVQRQYEAKERSLRSQFISLGTVLPVIQLHLLLCHNFTSLSNKFQFVDMAFPMIERLSAIAQITHPPRQVQSSQIKTNFRAEFAQALDPFIGKPGLPIPLPAPPVEQNISVGHPPPSKRQQNALRVKAMEGEGPFSNHCRSFDNQVKELNQQLILVKERLGDLHRDVALLRRAQTPPLISRYQHITGDCAVIEDQLERHQVELERMKHIFDTLWEEQLCRIHVEQEIFKSQMTEILNLRGELRQLASSAVQLEPFIKSMTASLQQLPQKPGDAPKVESQQVHELNVHSQQLQAILEHLNLLQLESQKLHKVTTPSERDVKDRTEIRSRPRTPSQSPGSVSAMLDPSGQVVLYETPQRSQPAPRGVISQLIDKVRTKEDRKKSPEDKERAVPSRDRCGLPRERSKSDGRAEIIRAKAALDDLLARQSSGKVKGKKERYGNSVREGKKSCIYQSLTGRKSDDAEARTAARVLPPPPPARRGPPVPPNSDIREKLEAHLKEKLQEMMRSGTGKRRGSRPEKSLSLDAQTMEELQLMLTNEAAEEVQSKSGSTTTSPRRRGEHRERSRERKDRERSWSRDRREPRDRSLQRDRSREHRHRDGKHSREHSHEGRGRSKERRRDKYGRCYPASDTEEAVLYGGQVALATRKQNSCDSLTLSTVSVDSRKSSQTDLGDRKTLVLVIEGGKGAKQKMVQKQRSWETFPPKKKSSSVYEYDHCGRHAETRPSSALDGHRGRRDNMEGTLRKTDSFEGHEEAVRTLVAAVHQTRSQHVRKKAGGHVSS